MQDGSLFGVGGADGDAQARLATERRRGEERFSQCRDSCPDGDCTNTCVSRVRVVDIRHVTGENVKQVGNGSLHGWLCRTVPMVDGYVEECTSG